MKHLFGIPAAIAAIIANMAFRGYVLTDLWGWFVVPLGAPQIGITAAIGLSLILHWLTMNQFAAMREDDSKGYAKAFGRSLEIAIVTLCTWAIGAAVHFIGEVA